MTLRVNKKLPKGIGMRITIVDNDGNIISKKDIPQEIINKIIEKSK
jgi:hypothetical protein